MVTTTQPASLRQSLSRCLLKNGVALWQSIQHLPKLAPAHPQKQLQRAIQRAYLRFAEDQPRWANSLFDNHFLLHHAAPILNSIHKHGRWPTAYELALAWFAQLQPPDCVYPPAQINAAMFPATAFLRLLQEEWTG